MISAVERLKVLQNIIARSGGIENIDLHGELSKALSMKNNLDAQSQINAMQKSGDVSPISGQAEGISPQSGSPVPQNTIPPYTDPISRPGGEMNMPPNM